MRDYLLDLVEHSYDLGCIDLIKITGTDTDTSVDGLAEDKSVVLQAKFGTPVADYIGTFGMPNLAKLKIYSNRFFKNTSLDKKSAVKNVKTHISI